MATDIPEDELPGHPRSFVQYLMDIGGGRLVNELTQQMRDLINGVRDTQKSGSLTLTLKVVPTRAPGMFEVLDTVTLKEPKMPAGASVFFSDEEGYLYRRDPQQPELFEDIFKEAPTTKEA